jgi:hypothetical protein
MTSEGENASQEDEERKEEEGARIIGRNAVFFFFCDPPSPVCMEVASRQEQPNKKVDKKHSLFPV